MSLRMTHESSEKVLPADSILRNITPMRKQRVLDLVKAAGVDVSDWKNFAGGERAAAANPKYCYEWAFVEPGRVVVLNLWFASMRIENGRIVQTINMRKTGAQPGTVPKQAVWSKRARKMDEAIKIAYSDRLPIRVVVCDGRMRQSAAPDADASRVTKRLLDPVIWSVLSYDEQTGDCTLTRGAFSARFVDQFAIQGIGSEKPASRLISAHVFDRDPRVRERVLERAAGQCELCRRRGFLMPDRTIYLETHHVIPLSEDGADRESNVAALCPNDHREAHYGLQSAEIRAQLLKLLSQLP